MNQTARNRPTVNLSATRSLTPQALRTSAPACPQPPRIRVLVADDHPVVRKGIIACLSKSDHLEIIAE
ncbi:MAG TPA: DNA-binding response regulator, partial [Clostridia bacterium]|nr:DNA-binding response regulator [Clostridia bacterium]